MPLTPQEQTFRFNNIKQDLSGFKTDRSDLQGFENLEGLIKPKPTLGGKP